MPRPAGTPARAQRCRRAARCPPPPGSPLRAPAMLVETALRAAAVRCGLPSPPSAAACSLPAASVGGAPVHARPKRLAASQPSPTQLCRRRRRLCARRLRGRTPSPAALPAAACCCRCVHPAALAVLFHLPARNRFCGSPRPPTTSLRAKLGRSVQTQVTPFG